MTAREAERFAERAHAGSMDRYGAPLLEHVRRVAAAVPREARKVAWLHETLECTPVSAEQLHAAGATADEVRAVSLLTREEDNDANAYRAHIARIARSPGRSGELARIVKHADLQDRLDHQDTGLATSFTRPPYLAELAVLTSVLG